METDESRFALVCRYDNKKNSSIVLINWSRDNDEGDITDWTDSDCEEEEVSVNTEFHGFDDHISTPTLIAKSNAFIYCNFSDLTDFV